MSQTRRFKEADELYTALTTRDLDNHLALFYRSEAEQRSAIVEYLRSGLNCNYSCLYIADEHDPADIAEWLSGAGIPVDDLRQNGALTILDASDVYGADEFDPVETVRSFEGLADDATTEGYDGLFAAGENTWGFDVIEDLEGMIEFEHNFDARAEELPATAVCQYDIDQFDDSVLADALQVHSQIIWDGELIENPYYVPTGESEDDGTEGTAELLLNQSRDISRSRQAVEHREDRLSVVNRVLRHNLRNETNVLFGRTEMLQNAAELTDEQRTHVETIEDATERLLTLSEQARYVDDTLGQLDHGYESIDAATTAAVERAESDLSVAVELVGLPDASFRIDDALEVALYELFAVLEGSDDDLAVGVTAVSEHGPLSLTVETESSPIQSSTARVLGGQSENALEHCLGIRAWITRWIVDALDGTVQIENTGPASVTLTVPAARRPEYRV